MAGSGGRAQAPHPQGLVRPARRPKPPPNTAQSRSDRFPLFAGMGTAQGVCVREGPTGLMAREEGSRTHVL